jgi:uncharacterized membrane protein
MSKLLIDIRNEIEALLKNTYNFKRAKIGSDGSEGDNDFLLKISIKKCAADEKRILKEVLQKVYPEDEDKIKWENQDKLIIKQDKIHYSDVHKIHPELAKIWVKKYSTSHYLFWRKYDFYNLFNGKHKRARVHILSNKPTFGKSVLDSLLATKDEYLINAVLQDLRISDLRSIFDDTSLFFKFRDNPSFIFYLVSAILAVATIILIPFLGFTTPTILAVSAALISAVPIFLYNTIRIYKEEKFIKKCLPYLLDKEDDDEDYGLGVTGNREYRKKWHKDVLSSYYPKLVPNVNIAPPATNSNTSPIVNQYALYKQCDNAPKQEESNLTVVASNNNEISITDSLSDDKTHKLK